MSAPRKPWSFVRDEDLARLVAAAIAAEGDRDRAIESGDDAAIERASLLEGRARDRILRAMANIGGPGDFAIILPDGSLFVRAAEADALAVVRPDRVIRLSD